MKLELRTFYPPWQNYRRSGIASPSILFTPFTPRSFQCENTLSKLMLDIRISVQVFRFWTAYGICWAPLGRFKETSSSTRLRANHQPDAEWTPLRSADAQWPCTTSWEILFSCICLCHNLRQIMFFCEALWMQKLRRWNEKTCRYIKYCKVMSCIDKHQCIHDHTCHIMSYYIPFKSLQCLLGMTDMNLKRGRENILLRLSG